MNNHIILKLKTKLEEINTRGFVEIEAQRNALKEVLQFYILDCIYHHSEYKEWTMYGGSALRICHKLDRMSVDLDFEIPEQTTQELLEKLKKDINDYFVTNYGTKDDFLTIKLVGSRGLRLNFYVGGDLGLGHASDQVHVKVDLNCFSAPKTTSERIPINQNQLSFVIKTYNMSNLMASKIAAIFLRGERVVGSAVFGEKGRDIYDLLWYMEKKIIPDLDYLKAKGVSVSSLQNLFDKLTLKMNEVTQKNLEDDLKPLFTDGAKISYWLQHWHESYIHLLKSYPIRQVTEIEMVRIHQDFHSDNYSFIYYYKTTDTHRVTFVATVSDYWIEFGDGNIPTVIDESLIRYVDTAQSGEPSDKVKQFATLFYQKIESYLAKTNREVLSDHIKTKIMRTTADNLNREEQIVLTKSALLSCEFDDLLK